MQELRIAIGRLHLKKPTGSVWRTCKGVRTCPQKMFDGFAWIYHSVLGDGKVPDCWRTCFHMLPKKLRAMHANDFRPLANLRLLYKVFAYLIIRRIEHTLDTHQPEEQHGFCSKSQLEGHLLTSNLLLDKAMGHRMPVWLVTLALSNAYAWKLTSKTAP